jgi:carbon monoxide dehydrogenase subunit G
MKMVSLDRIEIYCFHFVHSEKYQINVQAEETILKFLNNPNRFKPQFSGYLLIQVQIKILKMVKLRLISLIRLKNQTSILINFTLINFIE